VLYGIAELDTVVGKDSVDLIGDGLDQRQMLPEIASLISSVVGSLLRSRSA
jgi:hypothetical protein